MKDLSIIIPIYNVEQYLSKCIDSILNQKFNPLLFDIILINDGSSDNSLEIAEIYALNNDNVQLFSQENKGLSAARNKGIELADSRYICFLDADDEYSSSSLNLIFLNIKKFKPDILMFNLSRIIDEEGNYIRDDKFSILGRSIVRNNLIMSGKEFLSMSTFNDGVVSCIFRRDFLIEKNFYFENNIFYEDLDFLYKAIYSSKQFISLSDSIYICRHRYNSITRNSNLNLKLKSVQDIMYVLNRLSLFIEGLNFEERKIVYFLSQKRNTLLINLLAIYKSIELNPHKRRLFIDDLKKNKFYPLKFSFYKAMPFLTKLKYLIAYSRYFYSYT